MPESASRYDRKLSGELRSGNDVAFSSGTAQRLRTFLRDTLDGFPWQIRVSDWAGEEYSLGRCEPHWKDLPLDMHIKSRAAGQDLLSLNGLAFLDRFVQGEVDLSGNLYLLSDIRNHAELSVPLWKLFLQLLRSRALLFQNVSRARVNVKSHYDIPQEALNIYRFCCNFGPATSGWTVFDNDWTGSPIMPSDNPFKWRQFEPGLILLCVRWYLRYAVSYRDLEEMMRERGLCVDHTTIYRWVQRYAPEIDKRCRPFLRRTTDSYRIDETYVRVGGAWHYLYRGVDSTGDTLDFLLRATRDRNAAIAFFRKTVGASHTTPPRVVNVDKNPAYPIAFEAIKHEGFFRPRSSLRQCKYLNNVIEQDHRFIKRRTRPMLGFKQFTTAWRTVRGIEMMHALRKGQARWMAKGDVVGQTRLIHKVFGLAV